jgi:hypothetical protein
MDVTYEQPDTVDAAEVIEHVIATLAQDSGVLRSRHGDRLVVLYGRGVAAIEVAPRGAVLCFVTTSVSPARQAASAWRRPGRSRCVPVRPWST